MAIANEQLDHLERLLLGLPSSENPIPAVRSQFPGMVVSRCDAEDMGGESPFQHVGDYDLFLIDNSSHCWRIVKSPDEAGGVLLASRRD